MNKIMELAEKYSKEMIENRRIIHRNPELGGQEINTSDFIAAELEKLGIEIKRGFAKTGIQGMIYGKNPLGKTIMIRADIDALPMSEENEIEYKSQVSGKMHACGHDVHTAALLGAARILSQLKNELDGNVKLCFQPAEETVGGADLMVEDGILENPKVDYVIGMHVEPNEKIGTVSIEPGPVSSYPDFFEIKFTGKGGHGSFPSKSIDPILPAVEAYNLLNLIPKKVSPLEPCVVQICRFNAGTYDAIIPNEAIIAGTVRTLHKYNRELVKKHMDKIIKNISEIYEVEYELSYRGKTFPVYNTPEIIEAVRESVKDIFNKGFVVNQSFKIGGDDFCFFSEKTPATYIIVGSANEDKNTQYPLHNPKFNVDEEVIKMGAAAFSKIAYDYLNGKYKEI
ncbi:M20 family metallopeptidase [Fusobacterium sp.]|uniref:M20 metallopeptidase family protein n=1 Tax=Fusobacterium sp. TaxID=68766 RepID=UPI002904817F|nr:M20 family metallopeptidase [Fusobacterium sp.]MDU1910570.1 M20 family metallopeptidase [Fusobacterium sp.]